MATLPTSTAIVFPTNKHNRPVSPSSVVLHGFDLLNPPIQIRNHRFYKIPPVSIGPDLFEILKASLAEALELFPAVSGTVKLNDNGHTILSMDAQDRLGTPYITEIRSTPFIGDDESLAPRTSPILFPPSPTLAVKVTQFSCGVIAVAASLNHQVADLSGFLEFLELWAQITRGEYIDYSKIPDDWAHTPGRFFSDLTPKPGVVPPGFVVLATPAQGPSTFLLTPAEATRWKFGKPEVEKLKKDFSPSTGDKEDWISSGDAITALICGSITRARESVKMDRQEGRSPASSGTELICSAADGRERAPRNDMKGKYFGNFNPLFFATVSRADLSSSDNAASSRVALAIRRALNEQLSPQALADKIAFFESKENNTPPGRIDWSADLITTNWCKFDLVGPKLDLGWGQPFNATAGGGGPYPPGYMMMTQEKKTGDVHLLMAVEKVAAEALRTDAVLNKYGKLISVV